MDAEDIAALGLKVGEKVNVQSTSGKMLALQSKAFDLPKGNVMAYYPEANVLTTRELDPRSKTPAFKSIAVNIEPHVADY